MTSRDQNFKRVQEFHARMDGQLIDQPQAFTYQEVLHRADFKLEEVVELVAATASDQVEFDAAISHLHQALDKAAGKVGEVRELDDQDVLVGQVDALLDLLYFTYGSFALIGVDPAPIFDVVHAANMGKIWPDGKAHHDPVTNKILKPENWEQDFAPEAKIRAELLRQVSQASEKE